MQIGIDLGASKIESVLLDKDGKEHFREREMSPHDYSETLISIVKIVNNIEKKFNNNFNVGVGHPGSTNVQTGLLSNANNSPWMNNEFFQKDISKKLNRNVYCENDANCFALSEATDGFASQHNVVFGVILGSGCGGGLVIDKKIITGSNNYSGEWGHNALPFYGNLNDESLDVFSGVLYPNINIEKFISGKGLESLYFEKFNKTKTAKEIFLNANNHEEFIKNFYNRLARSLSVLINTIDPDAIVFGGGVSNEITDLDFIKEMSFNFAGKKNIKTNFLKAKFGDASGVRGAALLGRSISI
jgi:fructokinase